MKLGFNRRLFKYINCASKRLVGLVALSILASILLCTGLFASSTLGLSPRGEYMSSADTGLANGVYTISIAATRKQFDIASGSIANGALLQQYSANHTLAQRFRLVANADGSYTIVNTKSNKALDVPNANAASGANIWQYQTNGTNAQKWILVNSPSGFKVVSKLNSSLCLSVAGNSSQDSAKIILATDTGAASQRFVFTNTMIAELSAGVYFVNGIGSGKVLDVVGGSLSNGANLQIYQRNNSYAQKWQLSYNANNGYYTLKNAGSAKHIDIASKSNANQANAQVWDDNNDLNQRFAIIALGQGKYKLGLAHGDKVLDVSGGGNANGTNVQLYTSNNTAAQQWSFTPTQLLEDGVYQINTALSTVIDIASGSKASGANVQAYGANGTLAQKFFVKHVGAGNFRLENINSGLVLGQSSSNNVETQVNTGNNSQLWSPQIAGNRQFYLGNKASGKVLDVAGGSASWGTNIWTYTKNNTLAQRFSFADTQIMPSGVWTIASSLNASKVFDIPGASTTNGTRLAIYDKNDTNAQKFINIEMVGSYYRISNIHSGKVLAVSSQNYNSTAGTGNIIQTDIGTQTDKAQQFSISYAGAGTFSIVSALKPTSVMDLAFGSTANSNPINLYPSNNTNAQKWIFLSSSNTTYRKYNITLDQMTNYQKQSGQNPSHSLATLKNRLDPNTARANAPYQFVDLRIYTGLSANQLNTYINTRSSNMLTNRGQAFVDAARESGLNEAYLLGHCILETGFGTSNFSRGIYVPAGTYDGVGYQAGTYYNFYGIHAFDSNPQQAMRYAASKGWNTPEKAIRGGAAWIALNYIHSSTNMQNTLYDMKWDSIRSNNTGARGWHQYATDIDWPKKINDYMKWIYSSANYSPTLQYIIPQYK